MRTKNLLLGLYDISVGRFPDFENYSETMDDIRKVFVLLNAVATGVTSYQSMYSDLSIGWPLLYGGGFLVNRFIPYVWGKERPRF